MNEEEPQFKSFDEATQALRMELENVTMADSFPESTFEIAHQVMKLAQGDETFDTQKATIARDLVTQEQEFKKKYDQSDEEGKAKILETIEQRLNNFLRLLERHRS